MAQMVTHHASNGCNLRAGDLLASGTASGADKTARGCLLELTSRGQNPVTLPTGEQKTFWRMGTKSSSRDSAKEMGSGASDWAVAGEQICPLPGLTSPHSSVINPAKSLHTGAKIHQNVLGRINWRDELTGAGFGCTFSWSTVMQYRLTQCGTRNRLDNCARTPGEPSQPCRCI